MIYLELFWAFLKVGCFSFGGAYAAIPLIRDVVSSYGWVSDEMLANMIAVSESTPGPIMVNMATYVGLTQGGILGAVIATLATVLPAFIIILVLMIALKKILHYPLTVAVLEGLKATVIGIIFATGLHMAVKTSGALSGSFSPAAVWLTVGLGIGWFTLKYKFKKNPSPIWLIVLSAVLGMGVFSL